MNETPQPVRLQLSRRKGFDLQALSLATNGLPAISVARPGDLGNPYIVGKHGSRARCVDLFSRVATDCLLPLLDKETTHRAAWIIQNRAELIARVRDHNVACWCSLSAPCHGDIWLALGAPPTCEAAP